MNLKELRKVNDVLCELYDFFSANADGDETNLTQETSDIYAEAKEIISKEFYKLHLRNALSAAKRKNLISNKF